MGQRGGVTSACSLAGCMLIVMLAGCGAPSAPSALATVNDHAITGADLTTAVQATEILQQTALPMDRAAQVRYLTQLISDQLVLQWASHNHIPPPSAARVSQLIARTESYMGGSHGLQHRLSSHHLRLPQLRGFLAQQIRLTDAFNRETARVPAPTSSAVAAYYQTHHALFTTPARLLTRQIVVHTKTAAQAILAQLKKGASFSALARRDSLDKTSATQGGSLGYLAAGAASGLPQPVYAVMDQLSPGHYGIAHTRFGYHIIEVQAVEPGRLTPLTQVSAAIGSQLWVAAKNRQFLTFVKGLRAHAKVTVWLR